MSRGISIPVDRLLLYHREIGIHRGRRFGFRDVFGLPTLRDLPFVNLADRVKNAWEGRKVPGHEGWPAQREALRWWIDQGVAGIYAKDEKALRVVQAPQHGRFYIRDGHHRALALFVLGERAIRSKVRAWTASYR